MNNILSIKNLSLKAANTEKHILENIDLCVKSGDFIIILGANGSGKSSLIKTINKTYQNFKGEINFDLKDQNITNIKNIKNISSKLYSQYISTITQDIEANLFPGLSILENCILYESKHKNLLIDDSNISIRKKYKDYLEQYNIKLSSQLDIAVNKLSGGEKQSLILALTFFHTPKLLLLDEHTSALDPITGDKLMQITANKIAEKQITCIMATHSLDYALKYGNKIIALKNGKMIFHASTNKKQKLRRENLIKYCY